MVEAVPAVVEIHKCREVPALTVGPMLPRYLSRVFLQLAARSLLPQIHPHRPGWLLGWALRAHPPDGLATPALLGPHARSPSAANLNSPNATRPCICQRWNR